MGRSSSHDSSNCILNNSSELIRSESDCSCHRCICKDWSVNSHGVGCDGKCCGQSLCKCNVLGMLILCWYVKAVVCVYSCIAVPMWTELSMTDCSLGSFSVLSKENTDILLIGNIEVMWIKMAQHIGQSLLVTYCRCMLEFPPQGISDGRVHVLLDCLILYYGQQFLLFQLAVSVYTIYAFSDNVKGTSSTQSTLILCSPPALRLACVTLSGVPKVCTSTEHLSEVTPVWEGLENL